MPAARLPRLLRVLCDLRVRQPFAAAYGRLSCLLALVALLLPLANAAELSSAQGTLERLIPKHAKQFVLETIPSANSQDVFEIEGRPGKVVLRGNNGVALASALNRYLKEFGHCDISWNCGNQLSLPKTLPNVPEKIRVTSPHPFRFAYNYCTHGYTMAWWSWDRWERELDFLALSGVNMALIIQGQEQVWINTLTQFGYTAGEVRRWLVLPAHQPWMYMSNLEGYAGPVPQSIIDRRVKLGRQIVSRMRELGMEPVLQGYYGMVPADFKTRFPNARIHAQGNWGELKRPDMLEPTDPLFAKIAAVFYREQRKLFGSAKFLAADPFHEGGSTEGVDLPACGKAILDSMDGATWVLQSWQANPRQEMIDGLDKKKLLVLDLWCEAQENWRERKNFNGTPWLWCTIHNFGGNVGLGGRLNWLGEGPAAALADSNKGRMSGIGALLEGSGVNPVLWEMFFESGWRSTAPDMNAWLKDYAHRRYGAEISAAEKAWKILNEVVYRNPASRREYPVNSAVCARPTMNPDIKARAFVTAQPPYDTTKLVPAWKLLIDAAPQAKSSEGYRFDLADVGRQVLADLGTRYHQQIVAAYHAKDVVALRSSSAKMLMLIRDMDELVGTRPEFLLGVWLNDARRWGATAEEKNLCERMARELITIWTEGDTISDYANRQWSGLLGEFYHRRWEMWLAALDESLATGVAVDEAAVRKRIRDWEIGWTKQTGKFPAKPKGDVVAISKRLFNKYAADASAGDSRQMAKP